MISLTNKRGERPGEFIDEDTLKEIIADNSGQSVGKMVFKTKLSYSAIIRHLVQIGKVK